jgi:hypothetical protein
LLYAYCYCQLKGYSFNAYHDKHFPYPYNTYLVDTVSFSDPSQYYVARPYSAVLEPDSVLVLDVGRLGSY